MRNLSSYLLENFTDGELDKSVKAPEKHKVINALYKELNKKENKRIRGLYHDDSWEGVKDVTKICRDVLKKLSEKIDGFTYDISIAPINGGYRKNNSGNEWKEYKVELYKVPAEYEDYPEPFSIGRLNCHAAGNVSDVWNAYDMSIIL